MNGFILWRQGFNKVRSRPFLNSILTGKRKSTLKWSWRSLKKDKQHVNGTIMNRFAVLLTVAVLVSGCGGNNSPSNVEAPGEEKTTESKILGVGADVLQDKSPLKKLNMYLDGFHFYSGNMEGQMEAHHFVTQLNEDVHQAIIFDGNGDDAKIMGIEYIVSERLFKQLPDEEKKLWHSHHYEV